jgi:hypothetical protein
MEGRMMAQFGLRRKYLRKITRKSKLRLLLSFTVNRRVSML